MKDKKIQWHPGFVAAMNLELADSVFQVSIGANQRIMEELKGDAAMNQALLELMEPELRLRDEEKIKEGLQQGLQRGLQQGMQRGLQQGMQRGLQQGIQGTVEAFRKYGHGKAEIKKNNHGAVRNPSR